MGGSPLLALNLVAFPSKELPIAILGEILRGGSSKAQEAGIDILGGHSIDDHEPKYGLAVIGKVDPNRVMRNRGGRPGDRLVLTKPLGTGIITTAIKHAVAPEAAQGAAVASMLRLNREAAGAMLEVETHAATDITGFGLLGHLHYLALASGVAARVDSEAVPMLPEAAMLAEAGEVPSGTRSNERFLLSRVDFAPGLEAARRTLLCDAQTSGGLLMAVPQAQLARLLTELRSRNEMGCVIGELVEGSPGKISVR
jgi:selenide,water dikinase